MTSHSKDFTRRHSEHQLNYMYCKAAVYQANTYRKNIQ